MKKVTDKDMVDRIRAFQRTDKANKRCADCTEVGPTYVCLSFSTFVCTTCSGLHREFSHKIKGISVSKWTVEEVEEIERGGNARASEKFLSRWTPRDFAEPDSSDPIKCREFIRAKYVERRWTEREADQGAGRSRRDEPRRDEPRRDRDEPRRDEPRRDRDEPRRDEPRRDRDEPRRDEPRRDRDEPRRDEPRRDRDLDDEGRRAQRESRDRDNKPRDSESKFDDEDRRGDRRSGGRDDQRDDKSRYDRDDHRRPDRDQDSSRRPERLDREEAFDPRSGRDHDNDRGRRTGGDYDRRDEDRRAPRDRDREHDRDKYDDQRRDQHSSAKDRHDRRDDVGFMPGGDSRPAFDDFQPSKDAGSGDWAAFASGAGDTAAVATGFTAAVATSPMPSAVAQPAANTLFDLDPCSFTQAVASSAAPPTYAAAGVLDNPTPANPFAASAPAAAPAQTVGFGGHMQAGPSMTPASSPMSNFSAFDDVGGSHGASQPFGGPGHFPSQAMQPRMMGGQMPQMPQQGGTMPGMYTPQQLAQMNPQQLAQMQMMMQAQMQMMMQAMGTMGGGMPAAAGHQQFSQAPAFPFGAAAAQVAPAAPGGGQFNDLVTAFHQKNTVHGTLAAAALAPSGSYTGGAPAGASAPRAEATNGVGNPFDMFG